MAIVAVEVHILIVEDDREVAALVRQTLEAPNRVIHMASSAREGLEIAGTLETIHVALLDKMLPDRSGLEVAEALKRLVPDPEVILMTAYASVDSAVYALQVGAFDYLRKPFTDLHKIRFSVQNAIDKVLMRRRQEHLVDELVMSNERYELAAANDGLWDWNLISEEVFFSSRWKAMLGYDEPQIGADLDEWLVRLLPADRKRVRDDLLATAGGATTRLQTEYRILHADGTYRWMLARATPMKDTGGKVMRVVGSQTDITLRKRAEEQLRHAALYDELTGLPNRALFRDRLQRLIQRQRRKPEDKFAVLYVDVDRFKMVNDSLGRRYGDELLTTVARRLEQCVRGVDSVARFDGDHFAVLLDGTRSEEDAVHAAARILEDLSAPFDLDTQEVFITASVGVAIGQAKYALPEEVERDADIAMRRAKLRGGGHHELFDEEMHEKAVELLYLHSALHKAIERQEFVLHYQPLIDLGTGELAGFEALVRWQHPERGLMGPAEFIAIAEDTGLIVPIGSWVLRAACEQVQLWAEQFPELQLKVGVNLSGRQFRHTGLVETVRTTLEETGLDAHSLHLEVTESVIMENTEIATHMMEGLKALDVELHLDDFGTGFSSLSYLHRFPFDYLKIDKAFVQGIEEGSHREIVASIVTLARSLNIGVVAEGVETLEQLSELRRLDCAYGQGFLFAAPMSPEIVSQWLADFDPAADPVATLPN